jgi:hypothetical protein
MKCSTWVLSFLVFCLGTGIIFSAPGAATPSRNTLEGVKWVHLSIVGRLEPLAKTECSAERIRAVVESRLQEAGIPVMKALEYNLSREKPNLRVEVRIFEYKGKAVPRALYAYSVRLYFTQEVILARDPGKRIMAPTWNTPSVMGLTFDSKLRVVLKHVDKLLDSFIKDYHAANSPKSSGHR